MGWFGGRKSGNRSEIPEQHRTLTKDDERFDEAVAHIERVLGVWRLWSLDTPERAHHTAKFDEFASVVGKIKGKDQLAQLTAIRKQIEEYVTPLKNAQ